MLLNKDTLICRPLTDKCRRKESSLLHSILLPLRALHTEKTLSSSLSPNLSAGRWMCVLQRLRVPDTLQLLSNCKSTAGDSRDVISQFPVGWRRKMWVRIKTSFYSVYSRGIFKEFLPRFLWICSGVQWWGGSAPSAAAGLWPLQLRPEVTKDTFTLINAILFQQLIKFQPNDFKLYIT